MTDRDKQIEEAAKQSANLPWPEQMANLHRRGFELGARWADQNPKNPRLVHDLRTAEEKNFNRQMNIDHLTDELKRTKAALELAKKDLEKIPKAMEIEDAARTWATFSKGRMGQHFYEGALYIRSFILNTLTEIEKLERGQDE